MRRISLLALLAAAPLLCAAPLKVDTLRCELSENPTDIDNPAPTLSWRLDSGERGAKQSAWRILVSTTEAALARDEGELWDSGQMKSGYTQAIPYQGRSLRSFAQVFWKARSWNEKGEPSD